MDEQERCPRCGGQLRPALLPLVRQAVSGVIRHHDSEPFCNKRQLGRLECATKTWLEPCDICNGEGWMTMDESGDKTQVECDFCCGSGYVHRGFAKQLVSRDKRIAGLEAKQDKLLEMVTSMARVWGKLRESLSGGPEGADARFRGWTDLADEAGTMETYIALEAAMKEQAEAEINTNRQVSS